MSAKCKLFYVFIILLFAARVVAHETPIALLSIKELRTGVFDVAWTYSSSVTPLPPTPVFPSHCTYDYPQLNCGERGLVGKISLQELGEKYSAAVVQVARLGEKRQSFTLTGASPSIVLTLDGSLPWTQVMSSYVPLGFEHIMLGVDHLLFVLGLMMLVTSQWMLVKTITSFTIAHSITLAIATFGWVGVPENAVNAAIALSIVFVAVEILRARTGQLSLSIRWPWAIAFGFGLLHGFGFSSALTEIGLPAENLPVALLFFNVGVELGQLAFVFVVLMLGWSHRVLNATITDKTQLAAVYGMGSIASFWFITRMSMILNPL